MWGETRCNSECWYTLLKIQLLVRWWSKELLIRAWVSCNTFLRQAGKCIARITKSTLLCFIYFPPQSHFKVHCTHKFTFTSLQFWKKKNSFPFVISNFPVAFFIFSLLFLALPPEWKLKVGKLIDFLRFPSVQKRRRRKAFMAWYTYWALLTIINQVQKKIFAFAVVRWPPPPYFLPLE